MVAKVLMVQGSSSSAGRSLLVAARCRIYVRRGLRVAPFKAQNRSNNAAVCPDGRIWGCYLHGIFANDAFRRTWSGSLGWRGAEPSALLTGLLDRSLGTLAEAVEGALKMELLDKIVWEN